MKRILAIFCLFLSLSMYGQSWQLMSDSIFKTADLSVLSQAQLGGFNSTQLEQTDLNLDGIPEILILEKNYNSTYSLFVFEFQNSEWRRNKSLEFSNPPIVDFLKIFNVNCDSIPDLITGTDQRVMAHYGYYENGLLKFEETTHEFAYESSSGNTINIPYNPVNLPGFGDVDNDGDIDIIAFEPFNGQTIGFYENRNRENNLPCDSIIMYKKTQCWGNICECDPDSNTIELGYNLEFFCNYRIRLEQPPRNTPTRHAASGSILMFDEDGDGDLDILLGDDIASNIIFLENEVNDPGYAGFRQDSIVDISYFYPEYDVPVDVKMFPAAYPIDVDLDGRKDLVFSPYQLNKCSFFNDTTQNVNNLVVYKNVGDQGFDLRYSSNSLFDNQYFDFGEQVQLIALDLDQDQDNDIVAVGCFQYDGDALTYAWPYFENQGGEFIQKGRIHLDASNYELVEPHPTVADVNDDGYPDIVLADGRGRWAVAINNQESLTESVQFSLDTTSFASVTPNRVAQHPLMYDVSGDGLEDLLISFKDGQIRYFLNTGSKGNYNFELQTEFFGEVDLSNDFDQYQGSIVIRETPFGPELWMKTAKGTTHRFSLNGESLTPLELAEFIPVFEYQEPSDALFWADLNGNGVQEALIGKYRGGFEIYYDASVPSSYQNQNQNNLVEVIYYQNQLVIKNATQNQILSIYNLQGQLVERNLLTQGTNQIEFKNSGFYIYQIGEVTGKLVNP